jgi:hypothetical protein
MNQLRGVNVCLEMISDNTVTRSIRYKFAKAIFYLRNLFNGLTIRRINGLDAITVRDNLYEDLVDRFNLGYRLLFRSSIIFSLNNGGVFYGENDVIPTDNLTINDKYIARTSYLLDVFKNKFGDNNIQDKLNIDTSGWESRNRETKGVIQGTSNIDGANYSVLKGRKGLPLPRNNQLIKRNKQVVDYIPYVDDGGSFLGKKRQPIRDELREIRENNRRMRNNNF